MDPFLLAVGAYWLLNRNKHATHVNGGDAPTAFLYQLPEDMFSTTRLAVSRGGDDPQEMGIFGTPDAAIKVAQSMGATISHGGQVLALKSKPGAGS